MKTPLFEPEDFDSITGFSSRKDIANLANAKLQQLIDASPVVYGEYIKDSYGWAMSESNGSGDTHKAVLFNIEELSKEPCKHEHSSVYDEHQRKYHDRCKHCGVELVAEWKEEKTL